MSNAIKIADVEVQVQNIQLDLLKPHPGNRRIGGFDPDKLQQLAESIKAVGVQQPAVVRIFPSLDAIVPIEDKLIPYEIIAGERRWRAAKLASLETLPCIVRDLDDITVLKIQTIENLQREDIHPLDEAEGYARLIEHADYDVEHLAQEVGLSVSYVYQRLKLRDLVAPAKKMLVDGKITAGHAILIARLPAAQQKQLLKESWLFDRDDMPSVRAIDDYIHRTILLDLSKASFKKDDPDLNPQAGPCTTCPKRTGYQPALFADVCNGGKRDYCTDPPCFNRKLAAIVQRRRIELKESGEKYLEVAEGYLNNYKEEQQLQKSKVKLNNEWEECKKKDENAVRCIIVAGGSQGRLTWGRVRKQNRYGYPEKTAEEKAKEKEAREKRKLSISRRQKTFDLIVETATQQLTDGERFLVLDHEKVLLMLAKHIYGRLFNQYQIKLKKIQGWEFSGDWDKRERELNEKLDVLDQAELQLFILKAILIGSLDYNDYSPFENLKPLINLANFFDVDVSEIEAEHQVAEEIYKKRMAELRYEDDPEDAEHYVDTEED